MQIKYHKNVEKYFKRIKTNILFSSEESAGPIFGYFDLSKNYKPTIVITHLIDKTLNSCEISSEFEFVKIPFLVKWFNRKRLNSTKYIGTWHTHPRMSTTPSELDTNTFKDVCNQLKIKHNVFLIFNKNEYRLMIYKNERMNKNEIIKF